MRSILIVGALVAASGLMPESASAEEVNCAAIENARERLACYDTRFPRDSNAQMPKIRTEVIGAPEALGRQPTLSAPAPRSTPIGSAPDGGSADERGPRPAARPGQVEGAPGERSGGILDWQEDYEITATVKAIRSRDKQRMVFLLDNDQMWMQSSPRAVPIKEGDEVTIKSATVGGYIMRNQKNTTTRVQRIK